MDSAIVVALIVAVIGPMLKSWADNRRLARERAQDRADREQDRTDRKEVAKKVAHVAEVTEATRAEVGGQLTEIHTLVNSNMTASMQGQLTALRSNAVLLRRALAAGSDPAMEDQAALDATKLVIAELEAALADRLAQPAV